MTDNAAYLPNEPSAHSRQMTGTIRRALRKRELKGARIEAGLAAGRSQERSLPAILWAAVFVLFAAALAMRSHTDIFAAYPQSWTVPFSDVINAFMDWFVPTFKPMFRLVNAALTWPMEGLQTFLNWLPWPIAVSLIGLITYRSSGWRLSAFSVAVLLYILAIGYWSESMNTLSLVLLSVPLAIVIGLLAGILASKWPWAAAVTRPALDVMQTFPTFAYLIPILFLFGFGPVVGLIASIIFAVPPMVRNVMLGLERVPTELLEAGRACGATNRQLLFLVELPSALPTILVGVNQSTMASLSMVIIASVIGGTADIGWEVLSTLIKAQFGQSVVAGAIIVAIAIIMDRATAGFAESQRWNSRPGLAWRSYAAVTAGVCGSTALIVLLFPGLREFPLVPQLNPAPILNAAIGYITVEMQYLLDGLKNTVSFFFLLPLRMGMENIVRPSTWGTSLTPGVILLFWAAVLLCCCLAQRLAGWSLAAAVFVLGGVYYYGLIGLPWPAVIAMVTLLAFQAGGKRLAAGALVAMLFILIAGVWKEAMMSVYLCGAATLVSFTVGSSLGVIASQNDRFSAFIRPIADTLQTIPLFVFLIPVIMFFQVGDFSALLAIIMYAIVPSMRYTEFGIRNVSADAVEAGRALGCTRLQILRDIQIPMALPEIMMGVNQTIMFSLSMLVVSALVGTKDLGQLVYVALAAGDVGKGMIAGASMSAIAILTDRIIHSFAQKKRDQLSGSPAAARKLEEADAP